MIFFSDISFNFINFFFFLISILLICRIIDDATYPKDFSDTSNVLVFPNDPEKHLRLWTMEFPHYKYFLKGKS